MSKTNGIKIPTKDGNYLCATQEWGCVIYSWYEDTEGNFLRVANPKELLWAILEWNTPTIPSHVDREKTGTHGVAWHTEEEGEENTTYSLTVCEELYSQTN